LSADRRELAVVTGGTDGVGLAIALGLARAGCGVVVVGRDADRGERAVRTIRERAGADDVRYLQADVGEMREVDRLADDIASLGRPPRFLVHCAGVVRGRRVLTREGYESMFAINYLSRFALTRRLLPLLERGGSPGRAARILLIGGAAQGGSIRFDDVNMTRGFNTIGAVAQYARTNDVFTLELARRLAGTPAGAGVGIACLKLGPVRTNIRRGFPLWMKIVVGQVLGPLLQKTPEEAAAPALRLLLDDEYEGRSGELYQQIRHFRSCAPSAANADPRTGQRLWELSERLVESARATA
jgi:NAD(P)-dependent dehydrogenase (short-subunit alcohol dehydrogenase family)